MKTIKVVELFAGVGGFRLGFENASNGKWNYEIVWSNQWEPSTKKQHASDIYVSRFGEANHSNANIAEVDAKSIPDHDLLVGGFPCQDYSVAKVLSHAKGIVGKKGVLWWEIHRILKDKKPNYLLLENVDRLINSPAGQRGRDFSIILKTLSDLGYAIEWRVIDASAYGMPQRRKRVFIFGYHRTSPLSSGMEQCSPHSIVFDKGVFAQSFPVIRKDSDSRLFDEMFHFKLGGSLKNISDNFGKSSQKSVFENTGLARDGFVYTTKTVPDFNGKRTLLKDILLDEDEVPDEFYIREDDLHRWQYLKGSKREKRVGKGGMEFSYNEGAMVFPDDLHKPSRTIVTGEGGSSPSRFKHVVNVNDKFRRLTPVELERLCMFPDGHTKEGTDTKRAFLMGNALVVGVVEQFANKLGEEHARR